MKFRNIIFDTVIFTITLFLGLTLVGVYQLFSGNEIESATVQEYEETNFDINNPNSVLPLNFEEDKLTSPKTDENNPAYFDPEGYYYFIDEPPKGFEDFKQFNINNKNLDVDPRDRSYGDLINPTGALVLINEDSEGKYLRFENLEISNGNIYFSAKDNNGTSYGFVGEFLFKGNFYTLDENAKVLEGVLIKKENGIIVAKSHVTFGWGIDF